MENKLETTEVIRGLPQKYVFMYALPAEPLLDEASAAENVKNWLSGGESIIHGRCNKPVG